MIAIAWLGKPFSITLHIQLIQYTSHAHGNQTCPTLRAKQHSLCGCEFLNSPKLKNHR